jgi:4-hydroxy-3-methylbut-2-enyl diphosphate reductase
MGPRHDDICYATQNRQDAVKDLARRADLMLVVGSVNSSNSNRLRELAEKQGIKAYLVDGAEDVKDEWLDEISVVGVTAGASAPESLVQGVIERLKKSGGRTAEEMSGRPETIEFALPRELRISIENSS